jgi:hypothetical protein
MPYLSWLLDKFWLILDKILCVLLKKLLDLLVKKRYYKTTLS